MWCQVFTTQISLTLEGEKLSNPWRVLSLQVFIAGEDGMMFNNESDP